nr:IMP dehydrogenase [Caldilineaceae bacterium]
GLSYGGARTIPELQANAEFIEITAAGVRESQSHDVRKI